MRLPGMGADAPPRWDTAVCGSSPAGRNGGRGARLPGSSTSAPGRRQLLRHRLALSRRRGRACPGRILSRCPRETLLPSHQSCPAGRSPAGRRRRSASPGSWSALQTDYVDFYLPQPEPEHLAADEGAWGWWSFWRRHNAGDGSGGLASPSTTASPPLRRSSGPAAGISARSNSITWTPSIRPTCGLCAGGGTGRPGGGHGAGEGAPGPAA